MTKLLQSLFHAAGIRPATFNVDAYVITPINELARDVMGQAFQTTRSVLNTPKNTRLLRATAQRPEFQQCGATFKV